MKTKTRLEPKKPEFVIRVHLKDGSIESFAITDETEARRIWESIEPARLLTQPRLIVVGECSKSVFVSSQILRLDFIKGTYKCWEFRGDFADIVELSERDFRKHAHLDQPALMVKREHSTPVGDLLVLFLKLHLTGGKRLCLMAELSVRLPAESQSFTQLLLAAGGVHMRLREGGIGIINLAHLAGYTVYPGLAQVPSDSWFAEPAWRRPTEQT